MINYNRHGGGCCGIHHLWGFDNQSVEDLDTRIREHFAGGNRNRILEIILSDRQVLTPPPADGGRFHPSVLEAGGWPPVLAARGFVLAETWRNSNSGRRCYRFIKLEGDGTQTTLQGLDVGDLPFHWDNGRITVRESAPVEVVRVPQPIRVGDTVRLTGDTEVPPSIGDVTDVRENGTMLSVRWRANGREVRIPREDVVKVTVTHHAFDLTRPVEIVELRGNVAGRIRGPFTATPYNTAIESDGETCLVNGGWYHLDTGEYGRRSRVRFVRNVGDTHTEPLAPEQVNIRPNVFRTVLTEYFAHFRSGRRTGPYETMEALRAANPRVLSFVTRRILSDGTVETSGPARIPA